MGGGGGDGRKTVSQPSLHSLARRATRPGNTGRRPSARGPKGPLGPRDNRTCDTLHPRVHGLASWIGTGVRGGPGKRVTYDRWAACGAFAMAPGIRMGYGRIDLTEGLPNHVLAALEP